MEIIGKTIGSLNDVSSYLKSEFNGRKKEKLMLIGVDTNCTINLTENIAIQSKKDEAYFDLDELFRKLKKNKCEGFILAHNHPSGLFLPSQYDIDSTKNALRMSKKKDIYFMEHLIYSRLSTNDWFVWQIIKDTIKER